MFFKRKITPGELIQLLLEIRAKVEEKTIDSFRKNVGPEVDETDLLLEARIFSLWLLTLCLPPNNKKLKHAVHLSFCHQLKLDDGGTEFFLEEIAKRYKVYNYAFKLWQEDHSRGSVLGARMIQIIEKQDLESATKETLPLVGAIEAFEAVQLFFDLFKKTMQAIGNIKKSYKTQELD